jgi:flagellar motor switch protein FliM/N
MLEGASHGDPSPGAPPIPAHAWSGAVAVEIACGPIAIAVETDARAAEAIMRTIEEPAAARGAAVSPTPLTPVHEALGARPVRLRVELAHAEMDLGSLASLALGDIVPLAHPLDRPLLVHEVAGGTRVCDAHLGRVEGRRAIELGRRSVTPNPGNPP